MLYYNTISLSVKQTLLKLMSAAEFDTFRLVGGTALSLQLGHRVSIDIDLFTDSPYGSIDFGAIECFLYDTFPYIDHLANVSPGIGKSYTIDISKADTVKVDVFYTDPFIHPAKTEDAIRLATIGEIIAMKIDIVQRGGRKKDFWDLHELLSIYSIRNMLDLHRQRYEFTHDEGLIIQRFTDFSGADEDFEPVCLRGKYWEFIKEDIEDAIARHKGK